MAPGRTLTGAQFGDTEADTSRRNDQATDWARLLSVFHDLDVERRNRLISMCARWAAFDTEKQILLVELTKHLEH